MVMGDLVGKRDRGRASSLLASYPVHRDLLVELPLPLPSFITDPVHHDTFDWQLDQDPAKRYQNVETYNPQSVSWGLYARCVWGVLLFRHECLTRPFDTDAQCTHVTFSHTAGQRTFLRRLAASPSRRAA